MAIIAYIVAVSLDIPSIHLPNMSTTYFNNLILMHGSTDEQPDSPVVLSNRDYYCLQYNHAGTIDVKIDDKIPQTVTGPSLLITSPGHNFVFGNNEGWHHNYIAFSGHRVEHYISSGLLPVKHPLRQIHDSKGFFKQFEVCVQSIRNGILLEAAHQLEGLLIRLHTTPVDPESPPHHDGIHQLAAIMRESPMATYHLNQEAARLNISEAHLRRLFRKLIGHSPGRFLLQCRLTASADRLATTRAPIKQIASDYHFKSIHHFTRVFQKQYALPPGRFRREILGD